MKIFIAGIMQGSKIGLELHSQDYRKQLKSALTRAFPNSTIYDPFESNRNSLYYTPEMGKKVFLTHNRMCGTEIDVLIAFVLKRLWGRLSKFGKRGKWRCCSNN